MADLPTDQVQWDTMTIPSTLARAARMWSDVSALEDGDKTFTFRELEAAVQEASRAFIASGVERGDRVAIWAPNSWRWEIAALGLQCAGAVLVTLNTRFKASEAAYVLEKSGAKIMMKKVWIQQRRLMRKMIVLQPGKRVVEEIQCRMPLNHVVM